MVNIIPQDNLPSQKPQALTAHSHYSVSYSRITAMWLYMV